MEVERGVNLLELMWGLSGRFSCSFSSRFDTNSALMVRGFVWENDATWGRLLDTAFSLMPLCVFYRRLVVSRALVLE